MRTLPELRQARQRVYLEVLAETGRVDAAVKAAAIHPSLPCHWRRRDAAFAKAERRARQKLVRKFIQEARKAPSVKA
jgi:hypothetical protein